MRLLLALLITIIAFITTPAQKSPRLITCRATEIHDVWPPEAQLVINDTVRIDLACRNGVRLEIPTHKWPKVWGDPVVGKRVRMAAYADGRLYPVR